MSVKEFFERIKGLSFLDTLYRQLVFRDSVIAISPSAQKKHIKKIRKLQNQMIENCRGKKEITVMFFIQTASIWKFDRLYWLLKKSECFRPIVVVVPYNVHLVYDKAECVETMKKTALFVERQGYDYLCSFDFKNRKWVDVKKIYNPDVVFFSNSYKDTLYKYHLYNFKDKLTLYAPYGFGCIKNFRMSYGLPFHSLLWKTLLETEVHKGYAEQYSVCKGDNALVVGAFGVEKFFDSGYVPKDVWKKQDLPKKRIIWAPHHTVDYLFNFSNFLTYCDLMLDFAEKYKNEVQFAFKPHPVLKFKLLNIWGKEKTEEYYRKWNAGENTQLETGHYVDLFLTSDAMIHDCASFTAEYLCTGKPALFVVKDCGIESNWHFFGKKCYDLHYKAKDINDIESYIQNVVIGGKDTLKTAREEFIATTLSPKDGILPSLRVYEYLKKVLMK